MFKHIFLVFLLVACSSPAPKKADKPTAPIVQKEFAQGEIILGTQLLTKVFDGEMAPLTCVPDTEEASLLLRTIRPRMEVVEDDVEAMLDDPKDVTILVGSCEKNCTCSYLDDVLREHQVILSKAQRKMLNEKKSKKEIARCLNYVQSTFCGSELYKTLDSEKADFSFEEGT